MKLLDFVTQIICQLKTTSKSFARLGDAAYLKLLFGCVANRASELAWPTYEEKSSQPDFVVFDFIVRADNQTTSHPNHNNDIGDTFLGSTIRGPRYL